MIADRGGSKPSIDPTSDVLHDQVLVDVVDEVVKTPLVKL